MRGWRILRVTSGYGASIVVSGLVSLLVIPVIIHHAGVQAWSGVAVGQAVGTLFAVLVGFGWNIVGPARVASMGAEEGTAYLASSLVTRGLLLAASAVPYGIVVVVVSPDGTSVVVNAVAGSVVLVSPLASTFFFVGRRQPWSILVFDTGPRVVGTVIGALVLVQTGSLLGHVTSQLIGVIASVVVGFGVSVRGTAIPWSAARRDVRAELRNNREGVSTALSSSLYAQVPLVFLAQRAPAAATATYALADKLQKFSQVALVPVSQFAQGYVPSAPTMDERRRRARTVVAWTIAFGTAIAVAFAVLSPAAVRILSTDSLDLPTTTAIAFGITFGSLVVAGVTGYACLMAFGQARWLAIATTGAAAIGIPGTWIAATQGYTAVAWVVAATEVAVVVVELVVLRRAMARSVEPALAAAPRDAQA